MVLTSILAKGALVVAGIGAIGLGAAALIPIADLTADSWFDQPVDGAVLVAGVHDIRVHYRWGMPSAGLRVVSTTEFGEYDLTDEELELGSDEPGIDAYLAEYTVELVAGEYDLIPSGTRTGDYPAIHVIVLGDDVTEVPEGVPDPRPTETPEPEETEPPVEEPTEEPEAPEPPPSVPVDPGPAPSSVPSVPTGPAFSGSVTRNPGFDQWTSNFVGNGIGPAGAATRVQVNVRNLDTGATSGWVSTTCVDVGGGQCTAQRYTAPKPGASSTAVPPYEITFRLEVVASGVTWYGAGGTWYTDRYFNVG